MICSGLSIIVTATYHAVEFAALIALRLTTIVLSLSGTELTEVFGCLGNDVFEQFHLNSPQLLACQPVLAARRERKSKCRQRCQRAKTRPKRVT